MNVLDYWYRPSKLKLYSVLILCPLQVFTDCECVDGGTATLGLCERSCSAFYIYITVIFVTYLVTSMLMVPIMTVKMR